MNNNFTNHKNRGMLLEKIINKTINYYIENKIGFFAKNHLNIQFQSVVDSKTSKIIKLNNSFIKNKSTVDYYGIFNGKYVTFEAKSTEENFLPFANIKPHQHNHLKMISKMGGVAFYLIMFKKFMKIFLVYADDIPFDTQKSISYEEIKKIGIEIEIIFPGIIDFVSII